MTYGELRFNLFFEEVFDFELSFIEWSVSHSEPFGECHCCVNHPPTTRQRIDNSQLSPSILFVHNAAAVELLNVHAGAGKGFGTS